jgi:hypothetical protein
MGTEKLKEHIGYLALLTGATLPLTVMATRAGFYIGTKNGYLPCSRESAEYWPTEDAAKQALATGRWTQRLEP